MEKEIETKIKVKSSLLYVVVFIVFITIFYGLIGIYPKVLFFFVFLLVAQILLVYIRYPIIIFNDSISFLLTKKTDYFLSEVPTLLRKKQELNFSDIKTVDYKMYFFVFIYITNLNISTVDGRSFTIRLTPFSQKSKMELLRIIKVKNPQVIFSERAQQLAELKGRWSATSYENKVTAWVLVPIIILGIALVGWLGYIRYTREVRVQTYTVSSIGYDEQRIEFVLNTNDRTFRINDNENNRIAVDAVKQELPQEITIEYYSYQNDLMRNAFKITVDGKVYELIDN